MSIGRFFEHKVWWSANQHLFSLIYVDFFVGLLYVKYALLQQLQRYFSLKRVHISHNTYHHFIGEGSFDSNFDVILQSDES